jgi:hypothetical protein
MFVWSSHHHSICKNSYDIDIALSAFKEPRKVFVVCSTAFDVAHIMFQTSESFIKSLLWTFISKLSAPLRGYIELLISYCLLFASC